MALNEQKVLFQYGLGTAAGAKNAGAITFDSVNKAIYVGDGEAANLVTSRVKDASFASNKLTISFVDGSEAIALDFSDVASTENVMAVFKQLNTAIAANTTAIGEEADARELADASIRTDFAAADASIRNDFEAADASLSERIAALETGDASVGAQIAEAIGALDSSKEAEDASKFVKVKVDIVDGKLSENGVVVTTTDIASAAALAEVKATADAAAKQTDFQAHDTSADIHVTVADKTKWNAAEQNAKDYADGLNTAMDARVVALEAIDHDHANKAELDKIADGDVAKWDAATTAINDFLTGTGTAEVVDTLKDIQEWINGDGVDATELTKAIADEAKLRADADTSIRNDFAAADRTLDASAQGYASAAQTAAETTAKNYTDAEILKIDASYKAADVTLDASLKTYVDGRFTNEVTNKFDASGAAAQALVDAKAYADKIKVNGQSQTAQEITISGANILIGGTGSHKDASVDAAIEDLYTKVGAAAEAGVQSLAVKADSSAYAEVDKSAGAVTLTIKKVAIANATAENTGIADALDVKNSIDAAKSAVVGTAADEASANTVYGAKAYADAAVKAAEIKWTVLS